MHLRRRRESSRSSATVLRLLVAASVVGTTALAGITSLVDAAPKKVCNSQPTSAGGGWLAFKPTNLANPVTHIAAVSYAPDRIYATDGTGLIRTDDGGCTWTSLTLPSIPALNVAGLSAGTLSVSINAVTAPSSATSVGVVYVAAQAGVQAGPLTEAGKPYVFTSLDAGNHWQLSNDGLPSLGSVTDVAASDVSPTISYAVVSDSSGQQSGLYESGDSGATWTFKSAAQPVTGTLKVNPLVPNQLFGIFSGTGLEHSLDGGRSFDAVSRTSPDASYDVASGAGYIQMVQGYSGANKFDRSTDGGNTWSAHNAPLAAKEVAVAPLTNTLLVGNYDANSQGNLILEQAKGNSYNGFPVNPAIGIPVQLGMSAPVGTGLSITGLESTSGLVVRLVFNVLTNKVIEQHLTPIVLRPNISVKQFPSTLYPFTNTVRLAAGQTQDVPYQLLLPRTPSPVDLMFLVDTTASTDRTLDGVRQDLAKVVDELGSIGLDSSFGVADFRDYSSDDLGNGESGDYPYKLRRAIGPVNASLRGALSSLKSGGGGDEAEAQLTALYQSTTGAGQMLRDVDNHLVRVVRAGQQAGYRSDSLRLAIMTTDAGFHKEREYPTPSWAKTVAALRGAGVYQIGLAVQTVDEAGHALGWDSQNDEKLMATDTGALAPVGGVDCDGDGVTDIAPGAPLVCRIGQPSSQQTSIPITNAKLGSPPPPLHLASAIVDLAANLPDLRPVTLQIHGGPKTVASVVSNPVAPVVNLHTDNTLGYKVRFSCPVHSNGATYGLTLNAVAGQRALTSASTALICGPSAKPAPPVLPIAAAAIAAAPGGPPNPPAQGNANANPNPALNPNAGFAQQQDEERQLAFADADQGTELAEEESMAMSRHRPSSAEEAWMLGAAGLMMAGAGYATRRRWRTAYNRI